MPKTKWLVRVAYIDTETRLIVDEVRIMSDVASLEEVNKLIELNPVKYRMLVKYSRTRYIEGGFRVRLRKFISKDEFPPVAEISEWLQKIKDTNGHV